MVGRDDERGSTSLYKREYGDGPTEPQRGPDPWSGFRGEDL